jgi:hypothetical protein
MSASHLRNKRLSELLAQRAIDGLTGSETTELDRLLTKYPGADEFVLDNTASALLLASTLQPEPLPASLMLRLEKHAECFSNEAIVEPTPAAKRARDRRLLSTSGTWFALAASVLIAVVGWWPRLQSSTGVQSVVQQPVATPSEPVEPSPQELRIALLSHAATIQRDWQPTDKTLTITGDIVWDNVAQAGYMRFAGLPANDPQQEQYQLWIFDAARGDKYPVDGGVFDVPADGEVLVPVSAKLPIGQPLLFAVTREKAGGVVVSSRENIVVTAKVTTS